MRYDKIILGVCLDIFAWSALLTMSFFTWAYVATMAAGVLIVLAAIPASLGYLVWALTQGRPFTVYLFVLVCSVLGATLLRHFVPHITSMARHEYGFWRDILGRSKETVRGVIDERAERADLAEQAQRLERYRQSQRERRARAQGGMLSMSAGDGASPGALSMSDAQPRAGDLTQAKPARHEPVDEEVVFGFEDDEAPSVVVSRDAYVEG